MKILMAALLAVSAVLAQPVEARQGRDFGGPHFNFQSQQQRQQRPGGYQRQPQPQRDYRQPERQPDRRPDGRLNDQERRDLQRDLDRANREIYKGR